MLEDVILACCSYDSATKEMVNWFKEHYIPDTQNIQRWNLHTAVMGDCNWEPVHNFCKTYPVTGLFEGGHGSSFGISCDKSVPVHNGWVWYRYSDPPSGLYDAAGKIIYFLACSTGEAGELGEFLIRFGAKAFIGYSDIYMMYYGGWLESGMPWYALIEGHTVQEAHQIAYDYFTFLYEEHGGYTYLWDRDHLVFYGDGNARLFLPEAICSWLAENIVSIENIFVLIDSFLDDVPPMGYSFIPTMKEIFGVIDYYLGFIESGNTKTGCDLI